MLIGLVDKLKLQTATLEKKLEKERRRTQKYAQPIIMQALNRLISLSVLEWGACHFHICICIFDYFSRVIQLIYKKTVLQFALLTKIIKSNLIAYDIYDINSTMKEMKKANPNLNRKQKLTKHWFRCDSRHSGMHL